MLLGIIIIIKYVFNEIFTLFFLKSPEILMNRVTKLAINAIMKSKHKPLLLIHHFWFFILIKNLLH